MKRSAAHRFASKAWKEEIIGVPAMFMAFGIFLLYPGPYLLGKIVEPEVADGTIGVLALLLALFGGFVIHRFITQLRTDFTVLWDYSLNHLRMGTWVAGFGVLAALVNKQVPVVGQAIFFLSLLLWVLYLVWLAIMAGRNRLGGGNLNGTVFLSTVATQSIVITFMTVFPDQSVGFLSWLIILNVFGIALYWISFALVWVAGGFLRPLMEWVPQHNITHGALSITMLSAQMIEESIPGSLPYFHLVIQVAWVATSVLFVCSLAYEMWLAAAGKAPLLKFQLGNYARNFTYGMFFACSYYGYTYPNPSIMKLVLDPFLLVVLALVVLTTNVWELARQVFSLLAQKTDVRVAEST
ncbi:MAG: hypothetical protein WEB37_08425 [Bacteroidota bacterium]